MIGTYYALDSQKVNKQVEQLHDNFYRAVAQACEITGGDIITLNRRQQVALVGKDEVRMLITRD